jgi:hypothetical protein
MGPRTYGPVNIRACPNRSQSNQTGDPQTTGGCGAEETNYPNAVNRTKRLKKDNLMP